MAAFIIRVELIGSPGGDIYEALHSLMASQGFAQRSPTSNGGTAVLPHAMYYGTAAADCNNVATHFRDSIQSQVWTKAKVLAIIYQAWSLANPT